jgi:hypothetical protein
MGVEDVKPIPFETAKLRCIDRLLREEGVIGLLWVAFPFADQPFAIGVNGLLLVVDRDAPPAGATEHWKWSDARIEVHRAHPEELEKRLAAGDDGPWGQWLVQGEILVDPEGWLSGIRQRLGTRPQATRERKLLAEFSRFVETCVQAKQDMKEGRVPDAFSHIVASLHHWAQIVLVEEGLHPGRRMWEEIRRVNPGIYKLFEELTTSTESPDKRVQLLLLACEFAMLTKMKTSCALLLRILASRRAPWTVRELERHPDLQGLGLNLALVLQSLVKRGYIREEIRPLDRNATDGPMEVRYAPMPVAEVGV